MPPRSLVALGITFALAGCKEKSKDAPGAAPGTPSVPGAPGTPAAPAAPTSDLALLAGDAELVVNVDWQQLQTSTIWKQLILPQIMKEAEVVAVVSEIKTRCGIDLATDPKKVTFGVKGIEAEVPDGGAVVHGLDKAKAMACPAKFKAEADKEQVTLKTEGDIVFALDSDGYGVGVTFAGDRALILMGHSMTAERFKTALAGTTSLASSQAFTEMQGKIDTKGTGWGFFRGPTMEKEVADILGSRPTAVYGSFSLKDGVTAQVRARLETAEAATSTATKLKEGLKQASEMVDKADLVADGRDLKLDVAAAGPKLEALLKEMN